MVCDPRNVLEKHTPGVHSLAGSSLSFYLSRGKTRLRQNLIRNPNNHKLF